MDNVQVDKKLMKKILKLAGTHRLCNKCDKVQLLSEYDKLNPGKNNYLRSDCKGCRKSRNHSYHAKKVALKNNE